VGVIDPAVARPGSSPAATLRAIFHLPESTVRWLAFVLFLGLAGPAAAEGLAALEARWAAIRSLEASFVQVQRDGDGVLLGESTGRFAVERPGRFRWAYESPYEQILVSDGSVLWVHEPDLKQASRRPAAEAMAGTPAELLAGEAALSQAFTIQPLPAEGGAQGWRLEPRQRDAEFSRIDLWFEGDTPVRLVFSDPLGGSTEVRFSAPRLNARLPRATFRFSPPRGHEVVDLQ
jgi:outer membrane lipoprotein carrier protein